MMNGYHRINMQIIRCEDNLEQLYCTQKPQTIYIVVAWMEFTKLIEPRVGVNLVLTVVFCK